MKTQNADGSISFEVDVDSLISNELDNGRVVGKEDIEQLLIDKVPTSPLPLDVIPNQMGINLCSVKSIAWTQQEDEQLINLTINFKPDNKESK